MIFTAINIKLHGYIKKSSKRFNKLFIKELLKNRYLYLMLAPVLVYFILFSYLPMYGAQIAFKDFKPGVSVWDSPWAGLKYFHQFFNSYYFGRLIVNTVKLSVLTLVFCFPAPIILALLLNEMKNKLYKSLIQTFSYLPHFISLVVICGMILDFLKPEGLINRLIITLGLSQESISFMTSPGWFRSIYVISEIWQNAGWASIIYLAALTGIDNYLYEAAIIDGANRWRQLWNITLPGITPTIVILLIMNIGLIMSVGGDKVILLYNPSIYETADVISSFVYRRGIKDASFSFASAVGLFNSAINFIILILANKISKKLTESSLW